MPFSTTLLEGDFYRGLTRIQGVPFFNRKPKFAFQELWYFFCYKQHTRWYMHWTTFLQEQEVRYVLEKATKKLKEMDLFLKDKGYKHFIFISPSRDQVVDGMEKDMVIYNLLAQYELAPYFIEDGIAKYALSNKEKKGLFHDSGHLEKSGHELWAKIIAAELKRHIVF